MKIFSKDDLIKYIKISLGEPLIRVELAQEQFEVIIDQEMAQFHRYNAGEGSIYEYGIIELKKGKSEYNLRSIEDCLDSKNTPVAYGLSHSGRPNQLKQQMIEDTSWEDSVINIESVISVMGGGFGGINQLFTPAHAWFNYNGGAQSLGLAPTGMGFGTTSSSATNGYYGGGNSGVVTGSTGAGTAGSIIGYNSSYDALLPLSSYVLARQNMETVNRLFGERLLAIWRADAGLLRITPTPTRDRIALINYYRRENEIYLYNNILFQKLVIAACGIHWGNVLTKFGSIMAGGGSLNGEAIVTNWSTEYEKALENVKKESWMPFVAKG